MEHRCRCCGTTRRSDDLLGCGPFSSGLQPARDWVELSRAPRRRCECRMVFAGFSVALSSDGHGAGGMGHRPIALRRSSMPPAMIVIVLWTALSAASAVGARVLRGR